VNPGLKRRFDLENAFEFVNYTQEELRKALDMKLAQRDLTATDAAKDTAMEMLSRMRNRLNFGNIGEVENILNTAKIRYQERQSILPAEQKSIDAPFEPIDFDPDFGRDEQASSNLERLFENIVGCEEVVNQLDVYQKTARTAKALGKEPRDIVPMNFVFKGPPGMPFTKATVAK
jgi:thermostable 8-oxoguanine DNA glycosylase